MLLKLRFFRHSSYIWSRMDGKNQITVLTIGFGLRIPARLLYLFRGAIIHLLEHDDVLFHNHADEGYRYSYPLIQYRQLDGRAALVCIGDGIDAAMDCLPDFPCQVNIGTRRTQLDVDSVVEQKVLVQLDELPRLYSLRGWLPLNEKNYVEYQRLSGIYEKCAFLESILIGNILSFGKGVGVNFEGELKCTIEDIFDMRFEIYKRVGMQAFDLTFSSNVNLPDDIGLGKGVSLGFGTIRRLR